MVRLTIWNGKAECMGVYRNFCMIFITITKRIPVLIFLLMHLVFITCENETKVDLKAGELGDLVIIGGGNRGPEIMNKIFELAGGPDARIVIIPNASSDPVDAADYYKNEFTEMGMTDVRPMVLYKGSVDDQANLDLLEEATAVYFSGGDQSRLTDLMIGTKLLEELHDLYNNGALLAGTSAGAAVMSKIMITGNELINDDEDRPYNMIRSGNIESVEGFGFIKECIIDQHFIKRKRMNRLHTLVLENPSYLGIGIDEGTAIWVKPDGTAEVIGDSDVMTFNARNAEIIAHDDGSFTTNGVQVNLYRAGDTFSL